MDASIPYGGPFAYHGRGGEKIGRHGPSPALFHTGQTPPAMDQKTERALHSLADLLLTGPVEFPAGTAESHGPIQFPGAAPTDAAGRPDDDGSCRVELLLAGRVPGYAAPWLSQYVSDQTRSGQPMALVRFGSQGVELETYNEPVGMPREGGRPDLRRALQQAAMGNPRLALAPVDLSRAELSQRAAELERWTLLTGADDQAMVACYQVLKLLVTQGDPAGPTAGVGLVFVGCDEATAKAAVERITPVAERFLGIHVEMAGLIRRIEPLSGRSVQRFDQPDGWAAIAAALRMDEPEHRSSVSTEQPLVSEEEIEALREDHLEAPASPPVSEARADAPAEESRAPDATPSEQRSLLAGYVNGAHPIKARCPRQPRVELAVGPSGRLHLLMRAEGGPVEAAITQLLAARLWALEHRELLAMACADRSLDTAAEPVAHLFVEQLGTATAFATAGPPEARPLRLHLLKPISVAGEMHYVHEEV